MLILAYHAVAEERSPVATPTARLGDDLRSLKDAGYSFHTLDDCADWLQGERPLPPRSVAVTFDDGYRSVVESALPVLSELGVPATVFVIAGRLGEDNQWHGQWRTVPRLPLMSAADVREAADAGMGIGAHGWTHAPLPELEEERLAREVHEAGDHLEQVSGVSVRHFAYPYGLRGPREKAIVAERYRTAVSATAGLVGSGAPVYDLPRLDAHDIAVARRAHLLDPAMLRPYLTVRRALRRIRRGLEKTAG